MLLTNSELLSVSAFLQSLTLPAKVSRAVAKLNAEIGNAAVEYQSDVFQLVNRFNGTMQENGRSVKFEDNETNREFKRELQVLDAETVDVNINDHAELNEALKSYFREYEGDIAPEYAVAFNAFYDAIEED